MNRVLTKAIEMDKEVGKDQKLDALDSNSINKESGGSRLHNPKTIFRLPGRQFYFSLWYFLLTLFLLLLLQQVNPIKSRIQTIEYSAFKNKIRSGEIKRVEMDEMELLGFSLKRESLGMVQSNAVPEQLKIYRTVPVPDEGLIPLLDEKGVEYFSSPKEKRIFKDFIVNWILPLVLMVLIWSFLFRRMGRLGQGVMSFGQNHAQLVAEGEIDVHFDDVQGVDEAKEELREIVDFLKQPEKYTRIGGKIPKGILLVGPPGTGKTLCARAVAGEAGVPFFKISGADFVEMFVGVGAARVRDLFRQAREKAPCIIFIDELDAIGKARSNIGVSGHDEREQTLNQLLVEMDGFDSRVGVIILAATNRPEILDPALLRPGRFDRQILVDRPDLEGRRRILEVHTRNVKLDESVNLHAIASATPGFSGADLENLVNEAALLAVRRNRFTVGQKELEDAIEKIVAGLEKKNRRLNPAERKIVACHESGHALIAALTPGSDPVKKITIVPRGLGALGYTMQTPTEDRFLLSKKELLGRIDVLLGGRAAEELCFGEISTGASNDLTRSTEIARKMIVEYGMSEKFRNMVLHTSRGPGFLDQSPVPDRREYSEATQQYIDETVARIVDERYQYVLRQLKEHRKTLDRLSTLLLEKETVTREEFENILKSDNIIT